MKKVVAIFLDDFAKNNYIHVPFIFQVKFT